VVVVPLQGCKVEPYPRRSFILYTKIGSSRSSDSDSDNGEDRQDDQTLTAQFEDIIQAELDNEPTATEEHDIHIRPTYNIAQST